MGDHSLIYLTTALWHSRLGASSLEAKEYLRAKRQHQMVHKSTRILSDASSAAKRAIAKMNKKLIQIARNENLIILIVGVTLAALLRISLWKFETSEYWQYTGPWYDLFKEKGFRAFNLSNYAPLYPYYAPLYLYLMFIATLVFSSLPKLLAIKLIALVFEFICALFIYKIVRLNHQSNTPALFAFFAVLFAPTVVLNSSLVGQNDVIYTTALVACIYFLATKRATLSFVAFGLAFSLKLQALFLAPFLLVLCLKRIVPWRGFLLIPVIYVATILPWWLAGRPLLDLLTLYYAQSSYFHSLSMNAPNMWRWFPDQHYDILYPAGVVSALSMVFLFVISVYKSRAKMTTAVMVLLATVSVLLVPYFLPKMHERFFFPADVVSIIFAFYFPKYFFVPLAIGAISFFSYFPFLFGFEVIPLALLAVALLLTLVILLRRLALELYKPEA
jgi:Gpi18-like mannosyltransferase